MMVRHPELPERDRRILGAVVQAYIDQGEPVSSLWLASRGFGVSSATLRNVMARLEDQGYVRQPHTSAGRVPTDLGYRVYVDSLLAERRTSRPAPQVEARLRRAATVEDMLSHLSQEVSRASHQVGFAIAPAGGHDDARAPRLRAARRRQGAGRGRRPRAVTCRTRSSSRASSSNTPSCAGRQLSEQRVQRAVAARGAAGGPRAAERRAHALRRADGAGASARQPTFDGHRRGADDVRPGHVAAARGCRRGRSRGDARDAADAAAHDRGEDAARAAARRLHGVPTV